MNDAQIEKARELKAQGWSLRKIAAEVKLPLTQLFRALKGGEPSTAQASAVQASASPTGATLQGSARVVARIEETRAELAAIEEALEEIPFLKEGHLAAEHLDREALADLEERESAYLKEQGYLKTRLVMLAEQQETEEAKEAALRLTELLAADERLVELKDPAMEALKAAVHVVTEHAKAVAALYIKHRELVFEEVFLVERYKLPRHNMPSLGEIPNVAALLREVTGVFAECVNTEHNNPWVRKRRQWEEQRRTRPAVSRSGGVSSQQ